MSHVKTVDVIIQDLQALAVAADLCGGELVQQSTYKWFGKWVRDYHGADAAYKQGFDPKDYGKCEYAIRLKNNSEAYEVGVVKRPDGQPGYTLIWDDWAGGHGLIAAIGKGGAKLHQEYALRVAMIEMIRKGFRTIREINPVTNRARLRAWRS